MRQGLNSISVMILNLCSAPYGDAAIAAMSIVTRIIMFLFCIALGIGQGFQPVSAFNYGAKKYSRVREAFWFSIQSSLIVMSISALIGIVFSAPIVRMFRVTRPLSVSASLLCASSASPCSVCPSPCVEI